MNYPKYTCILAIQFQHIIQLYSQTALGIGSISKTRVSIHPFERHGG